MNRHLFLITFLLVLFSHTSTHAQKLKTCNMVVWKGQKANRHMEKIPVYMGKDPNSAPIAFYHSYPTKTTVWKTQSNGTMCLADTVVSLDIFRVVDTVKCRDFNVRYYGYDEITTQGTKEKVKGFCSESAIIANFEPKLTEKLIAEGFLTETPDKNIGYYFSAIYTAIAKYQEKYDLGVGALSVETAKHMKLIE